MSASAVEALAPPEIKGSQQDEYCLPELHAQGTVFVMIFYQLLSKRELLNVNQSYLTERFK